MDKYLIILSLFFGLTACSYPKEKQLSLGFSTGDDQSQKAEEGVYTLTHGEWAEFPIQSKPGDDLSLEAYNSKGKRKFRRSRKADTRGQVVFDEYISHEYEPDIYEFKIEAKRKNQKLGEKSYFIQIIK